MRRKRISTAAVGGLAATLLAVGTVVPAHASGNTLTVNVGTVVRPVTHVAAGGLYGVDTGTTPPLAQLYPLHLNNFTQPPPGTQQLGNGASHPCCDGLQVAGKVISAGATAVPPAARHLQHVPVQLGELERLGVEDPHHDHGSGQRDRDDQRRRVRDLERAGLQLDDEHPERPQRRDLPQRMDEDLP